MRQQYKNYSETLKEVAVKYELKSLNEKTTKIQEDINNFKMKVLFVGEFSAGKSALINKLIGEELLEENQLAETAIASEIIYDEEEYVDAVCKGSKTRYSLEKVDSIDVEKYDYLVWHLNRENLKSFRDVVIVDMPGYNSTIKSHNKAILNYVDNGNAYILVLDPEEGTIKEGMIKFLSEIKNYNNNVAAVVSKSDLKPASHMDKILENVKLNIKLWFSEDVEVITTSKYDDETPVKIKELVNSLQSEDLFKQCFQMKIMDIALRCEDSLEIYKNNINCDLSEFEEKIRYHENMKDELQNKLQKEKDKLETRFRNSVAPSIVAEAEEVLYSNVALLAESLKNGSSSFQNAVNNLLRPTLLNATEYHMERGIEKFIGELDLETICFGKLGPEIGMLSEDTVGKLGLAAEKIKDIAVKSESFNAIYKTIATTLAVATSAVAPWLELILIFLPDILRIFSASKQDATIHNKVNGEIIPQIISNLKPNVESTILEMKEQVIEQIESQFSDLIDSEKEALESAKKRLTKKQEEITQSVNELDNDLEKIREVIKQLTV